MVRRSADVLLWHTNHKYNNQFTLAVQRPKNVLNERSMICNIQVSSCKKIKAKTRCWYTNIKPSAMNTKIYKK